MTLYEMTESVGRLYALLESGEIDEQTFSDTVEAIGAEEKLEGYCQIIKQLKAEAEMFRAERSRLGERLKALENNIERMRAAVLGYMVASGETKTKAGTFSVSVGTAEGIEVFAEDAVPIQYRIPQPDKIDERAIKEAVKAGAEVAGVKIVTAQRLTIR